VKIRQVEANNHKRAFLVHTRKGTLPFPYSLAEPAPSREDRLERVFVDPDLDREAFTYELGSGEEGTVHIDSVLDYNADPDYLAELMLYKLTLVARERLQDSELSTREIARLLGTSPTQLYRLTDPTNTTKSLRQMLALLHVLGCEVDFTVHDRSERRRA
jgi:hypothetical protein